MMQGALCSLQLLYQRRDLCYSLRITQHMERIYRYPGAREFLVSTPADEWSFGDWRVGRVQRRLWRGEHVVPVGAHAFEVLCALIERRDRFVTTAELLAQVWPGLVV